MAYTKYSLTPANNNAAPPDGAPEGMLPSAVNDTMRDMMAQIRDAGDGIRNGTYTMTAPVITGGSISGASVSATSLTDSGNLTFTGTGNRITGDFSNATVANRVAFQSSTTNGNSIVGILPNGTSTTSALLVETDSATTNSSFAQVLASSTEISFRSGARGSGTQQPMTFHTNGSERLRIDTSGNVGIGTSSISVPSGFSRFVAIGDSDTGIGQISDGVLAFATNNTEKVRIDANGNFLVGTTAASYNFSGRGLIEVNGSSESLIAFKIGGSTTNAVYQYNTTLGFETNVTGSRICYWSTNGSERMRLDSSGRLCIGTTDIGINTRLQVQYAGGGTQYGLALRPDSDNTTSVWFSNAAGSGVGSITQTASATAYNTSSDYRLKENIAPMTGALNKVAALKPCTYTWKTDGSNGQGFIAHELQAVVPDCVTGEKDAVDAEGNPKYQGIDTSFLVATLTAAIQELKAELDSVKAELQTLKGN